MKTKIISKLKKELLIIEWQDDYEIVGKVLFANSKQKGVLTNLMNLEGYTLLGKPDEIKEEDVKNLVHSDLNEMTDEFFCRDYKSDWVDNFDLLSALESFHSALEKEIYWQNPLANEIHAPDIKEWKEAQEKTFDKKKTLIFVKN